MNKKAHFDVELAMRKFADKRAKRSFALADFNKNLIVKFTKVSNEID